MKRQSIWSSWIVILLFCGAGRLEAQKNLPQEKIPASVMTELNQLSVTFQDVLARDCPADICVAKGCAYEDHQETKTVESRSLPGLDGVSDDALPTDVAQNFLTKARCEFAYESKLNSESYGILRNRLQQKLSRGFLTVGVQGIVMNPLPESLQDSEKPPVKENPEDWKNQREKQLWNLALQHGPWIIGLLLATLATLLVIWAIRKLGKKTFEDELAEAEMLAEAEAGKNAAAAVDENAKNRLELIGILKDQPEKAALIARYWLEEEDFAALAQILSLTELGIVLPQDPALAISQQKFQQYLLESGSESAAWSVFKERIQELLGRISILMDENLRLFHHIEKLWRAHDLATVLNQAEPVEALYILSRFSPYYQWSAIRALDPKAMRILFEQAAAQPRIAPASLAHTHSALRSQMGLSSTAVEWDRPKVKGLGFPVETTLFIRLGVDHGSFGSDRDAFVREFRDVDGTIGSIKVRSFEDLQTMAAAQRRDLLLMLEPEELVAWLSLYPKGDQELIIESLPASLGSRIRSDLQQANAGRVGSGVLTTALRKIHSV